MVPGRGETLYLKIKRDNREMAGDSLDVHSCKARDGIPSETYAIRSTRIKRIRWTRRIENIDNGIELV